MSSLNRVMLIGNLGKDPEIRSTTNGNKIASFSLATSDTWKDKQSGEKRERTEWHKVVIFNEHLVKITEDWLTKGSKIYVEGALQTRKWTDKDGSERYSTEIVLQNFAGQIVMLSSPNDRKGGGSRDEDEPRQATRNNGGGRTQAQNDLDDEIPF